MSHTLGKRRPIASAGWIVSDILLRLRHLGVLVPLARPGGRCHVRMVLRLHDDPGGSATAPLPMEHDRYGWRRDPARSMIAPICRRPVRMTGTAWQSPRTRRQSRLARHDDGTPDAHQPSDRPRAFRRRLSGAQRHDDGGALSRAAARAGRARLRHGHRACRRRTRRASSRRASWRTSRACRWSNSYFDLAIRPRPPRGVVLFAPCSFNSLNKLAHGIADNLALSVVAEAIGRGTPVIVGPSLNQPLLDHPDGAGVAANVAGLGRDDRAAGRCGRGTAPRADRATDGCRRPLCAARITER